MHYISLTLRAPRHGADGCTPVGYTQQPGGNRSSSKVGNRIVTQGHHIPTQRCAQVPGLGRFPRRMDRDSDSRSPGPVQFLDQVFRRVEKARRSRSGCYLDFTQRRQAEICTTDELQEGIQQRSRIRGPIARHTNGKACGATRLMIYGDSNLVVQQMMKACDAVSADMAAYRDLYNVLEGSFDGCELCHIARDRKSTRLNSSHSGESRMPSSA